MNTRAATVNRGEIVSMYAGLYISKPDCHRRKVRQTAVQVLRNAMRVRGYIIWNNADLCYNTGWRYEGACSNVILRNEGVGRG